MKKILSVISAVALMFAGCTNDLTNDLNAPTSGAEVERGPLVEKTAVITDNRVGRDSEGKLSWSEGDKIAVVLQGADGTLAFDSATYTIDAATGKVAIPSNAAYVIYPHNLNSKAITSGSSVMTFKLANNATFATPEDIFKITPMKGVVGEELIEFNNLMAFAKFTLKGTGKLKQVILRTICNTTSDFHPISQSASIDLSCNVTEDGGVVMKTNNDSFAWMRQIFSGDIDLSTNPSVYIPVPEGEYENMGLVVVTDKGSHTIYANNKHQFTRSTVKSVSQAPIDLDAHTPQSPVSLAGNTGKACEDYARCYLVPPTAGSYEFPCTLADGVVLKGGVTAEIKWAEEAGMIYDFHFNPETNKISFKTNGKEGNALVALTDGSTIIWHWHIWVSDAPKVLKVLSTDGKTNYYVMDRVVGATWSPSAPIEKTSTVTLSNIDVPFNNTLALEDASDACGLYFMYQNCVPYPRIKSLGSIGKEAKETLTNTRCGVMYGYSQYSQYWTTSASGANVYKSPNVDEGSTLYIHNGIRMPNYMYYIGGKGSVTTIDSKGTTVANDKSISTWILDNVINKKSTNSNNPLVEEGKYRFWCSHNNNNHDTMMSGKTNHDPCPPGYIIENYSIQYWYMTTRKAKFGYTRAKDDNATYKSGYKFYGMYLNDATDEAGNNVPIYWPCCGNRASLTTGVSGQYANCGYIYSVNTNNDSYFTYNEKVYGVGAAIAFGEVASTYSAPGVMSESAGKIVNGQGYNVRCRRGKW